MAKPLVVCDNLVKIYKVADLEVVALQGLDLEVASGEMMAIVGASGSGKTTLLNILSGLDMPSAGRGTVSGYDLTRLTEEQRTHYRRFMIGHIWQQSGRNLLHELTFLENRGTAVDQRLCRSGAYSTPTNCWISWHCNTWRTICPTSFPAASSSAPPSRSRWRISRACCSPMSRPASSTPSRRARSSPSCTR